MTLQDINSLLNHPELLTANITAQLDETNTKLNELSQKNDYNSDEFVTLSQQLQELNTKLSYVKKASALITSIKESKELAKEKEYYELATEQIDQDTKDLQNIYDKLKDYTAVKLDNDESKAILEIRPGVGGTEASLFAEDLYNMYLRLLKDLLIPIQVLSIEYDSEGGIKEAVILADKPASYALLRFEAGVHRVQRVPKTESSGRIHTSTASVVVMPQADAKDIKINPTELRIDVYRSSGPGGQSVNTTDSAVRITHLPTNIVVTCQQGKSQHKNKEMALSILYSKLQEIEKAKEREATSKIRSESISGGDRSAKIRTYNFQQSRVTDHRVGLTFHNLSEILYEQGSNEFIKQANAKLREQIQK